METQTTTAAVISRKAIANYSLLNAPGKQKLIATGQNNKYINPRLLAASERYSHSVLVNFRAIEGRKAKAVIEAFGDEDRIDLNKINKLTFVHEVIVNKGQAEPIMPAKGEEVEVQLEWAIRDGVAYVDQNGAQVLNVTSLKVTPAIKPMGFGSLFASASVAASVVASQADELE